MKKVYFIVLSFLIVISTFATKVEAKSTDSADLQASVVPILKSYEIIDENKTYKITEDTRLVLESTSDNKKNNRLQEVLDLVSSEFLELGIPDEDIEIKKLFANKDQLKEDDIFIEITDLNDIHSSSETYQIDINHEGIHLQGASERAVLYGLRTLMHLSLTQKELPYGKIVDYPDLKERRVHVDMGRKYFTKDWVIQQIKELSYLKMNALQMHFSENMGYRIESDVAPEIVSDEYLTKDEVREIIEVARIYDVDIIPSFDTPGHTAHILKSHPEFGQIDINGERSKVALDVTNPDAVQFVYDLLDEIMELFSESEHIHLGADEYMEFDRPPFTTHFMPVLNQYAKTTLGEGFNWKDVMATYINNMAEYVYERGFKPRIWNDGIYYGEKDMWCAGGEPQKVKMHSYIGIDFWSQMAWNPCIAKLQTFIDKGHTDIYNVNASFFYYVLRPDKPDDGREQHSFDYPNQDIRIFDEWSPGKFQENTIDDDHPSISGASLAIWNDVPDLVGEDVITEDISKELRSLATKSWNTKSNQIANIYEFREAYTQIGNVPSFEKGSSLKDTKSFIDLSSLDFSELDKLVSSLRTLDEKKYTKETFNNLNSLLKEVTEFKDNVEYQSEIDIFVAKLEEAYDNLQEKDFEVDPTDPLDPTDPTDPLDPTDPTDPTDPLDPTDPTDPLDPLDSTDPTDPLDPTDPTDPLDPESNFLPSTGVSSTLKYLSFLGVGIGLSLIRKSKVK